MTSTHCLGFWVLLASLAWASGASGQSHAPLLDAYASEAKAADPAFGGFSAQRGEQLFKTHFATGKPDTPSCTACHTTDPKKMGQTRAGKDIEPMAASVSPKRYTDQAKVEKWFGRNCKNVLGRDCTAAEKGDFITFMLSQ